MATGTMKSAAGRDGPGPAGTTLSYLGLMVILPMAALVVEAARPGVSAFVEAVRDPFAWHALKLTFITAAIMVVVNALTGTATAWVLVRYDFPGRGLVNALIDLPFAVPTVVTGRDAGRALRAVERAGDDPGAVRVGGRLPPAGDRPGACCS